MVRSTLLLLSYTLLAQLCMAQDTVYCNNKIIQPNKEYAGGYLVLTKVQEGYDAAGYSMTGQLKEKGHYTKIEHDIGNYKEGYFVLYYSTGRKMEEGIYIHGKKDGLWKFYLDKNEIPFAAVNYTDGSKNGPAIYYNPESNTKTSEGQYVNGKMEGVWKNYLHGELTDERTYKNGETGSGTYYYPSGKIRKTLLYMDGKVASGHIYDESGKELRFRAKDQKEEKGESEFVGIEQMPAAGYDINKYIGDHLVYPEKAREKNKKGRVIIKFVVNEDGHISDVTVEKSVYPLLDDAAQDLIANMPDWATPGRQNGGEVKVYFTIPIVFRLQ